MKIHKFLALVLSFLFLFSGTVFAAEELDDVESEKDPGEMALEIEAPSAILIDADTGIAIYEKDVHEKKYPASITKVMTALLTLEYCLDMNERVLFSADAVYTLPKNSSTIYMDADETLTVENALYALMLESANEVANALAEHIAGDIDEFGKIMTSRAQFLGAKNTNFTNPHGLHDENHYTTAYDMALIMREAIKKPKFLEIINTTSKEIPATEKFGQVRNLINSNKMIFDVNTHYYEDVIGGKTGFTDEAGNTLVTYASRDGINLISVVMHENGSKYSYSDTAALLNYGFEHFDNIDLIGGIGITEGILLKTDEVETEDHLPVYVQVVPEDNINLFLPDNVTAQEIERIIDLPDEISPPVFKNQVLGSMVLKYDGIELAQINLISTEDYQVEAVAAIAFTENSSRAVQTEKAGVQKILSLALKGVLYVFSITVVVLLIIAVTARLLRRRRKRIRLEKKKARARARARAQTRARVQHPAYQGQSYAQEYRYKDS